MPPELADMYARIVSGVGAIAGADWQHCYPGEAEGWSYYRACEREQVPGVALAAVEVRDREGFAAGAPIFQLSYRLDTPLQGAQRRIADVIARRLPALAEWRLLGVGSPYTDRCHIAIRPGLSGERRAAALRTLIAAVESEAEIRKAALIVYKDLAGAEYSLMEAALGKKHYTRIRSLPVAVVELRGDMQSYMAQLSPATRKDVRRKLKLASKIRIERRSHIDDVAEVIGNLYEETRHNSRVRYGDFEALPRNYFLSVAEAVGESAHFCLYWVDDELAAFNLLLLGKDRVIDKFLGMRYPLAQQHNLYVISWMENVRLCVETGRRWLQSGQTAYRAKIRLGSRLVPSSIFARHRNPFINRLMRLAAPIAAFDRWDPDLRYLTAKERAA